VSAASRAGTARASDQGQQPEAVSDRLSLSQLHAVEQRLPDDVPARLRGELRRYIAGREEARHALLLAALHRTPEQLADDSLFISELTAAYSGTIAAPVLAHLAEVVEQQRADDKLGLAEWSLSQPPDLGDLASC
jgi:hypothetical protein